MHIVLDVLYKYFTIYLLDKLHMNLDTPGCSSRNVGIKCDILSDTIHYTCIFDKLPYHLVNIYMVHH